MLHSLPGGEGGFQISVYPPLSPGESCHFPQAPEPAGGECWGTGVLLSAASQLTALGTTLGGRWLFSIAISHFPSCPVRAEGWWLQVPGAVAVWKRPGAQGPAGGVWAGRRALVSRGGWARFAECLEELCSMVFAAGVSSLAALGVGSTGIVPSSQKALEESPVCLELAVPGGEGPGQQVRKALCAFWVHSSQCYLAGADLFFTLWVYLESWMGPAECGAPGLYFCDGRLFSFICTWFIHLSFLFVSTYLENCNTSFCCYNNSFSIGYHSRCCLDGIEVPRGCLVQSMARERLGWLSTVLEEPPPWVYESLYIYRGYGTRIWLMQLAWFFHMKFYCWERISGHFQLELHVPSQGWVFGSCKKKKKKKKG